jgi:hypothetical protein
MDPSPSSPPPESPAPVERAVAPERPPFKRIVVFTGLPTG